MPFPKPLLLITALSLSACATSAHPHNTLSGQWQIIELANQAISPTAPARLYFDTANTQFSARTDCNHLFGQFNTQPKQQLTFSAIAATRMACENSTIEQTLSQTLPKVRQYRINGEQLEMADAQGKTLLRAQFLQANISKQ